MVKVSLMPALRRQAPTITRAVVVVALFATLAAAPAAATAQGSSLLWATVNICDTPEHPDTVGIRGSMPGSGVARERMFIRFRLEYLDTSDETWRQIADAGDSGWIPVGSGKYRRRQSGRNFTVRPPETGAFRLRARVAFEWRRGVRVTRSAVRRTSAGRPPTAGADPSGYSAATCDVMRP